MQQVSVLVTSVGGIGEQIVKALRLAEKTRYTIVGCDMSPQTKGLLEVDYPYVLPSAGDPSYLNVLLKVCRHHHVAAVLPGSEPELKVLSDGREMIEEAGLFLPINPASVIELCLDKVKTSEFLASRGFAVSTYKRIASVEDLKDFNALPAVLKPSKGGGGSANVYLSQTREEFLTFGRYLLGLYSEFVTQEYVGTPDAEFTVGVLCDMEGGLINSIAVRRNILTGLSNRIKVPNRTGRVELGPTLALSSGISQGAIGRFPEVTETCERIAEALGCRGAINIQCRLFNGKVYVFEINPRFSGTTSLRALVGYNEPDILIRRHLLGEKITHHFSYQSGTVLRGLTEVFFQGARFPFGTRAVTSETIEHLIDLGDLPFYVGEQDLPTNPDLPDVLPFKIGFRPQLKLLVQIPDKRVEQYLAQAYHKGSIVGSPMEEEGIGRLYADDFLNFIERSLSCEKIHAKGARALEIGCGSGYLLYRLQKMGADVLGVEPGEHGQAGAQKYDVKIVRRMFDGNSVSTLGHFDLILHFTVMEHVMDVVSFLAAQAKCLTRAGLVMFAVPDCGEYIQSADVSMLMHEHWNYFSPASLKATVEATGLNLIHLERAAFGGCLYAVAGARGEAVFVDSQTEAIDSFASRLGETLAHVGDFFAAAERHKRSIGVYCPGRFYNLLHLIKPAQSPRFFDDAERLQGRYYPPIKIAVESRSALLARPVDDLLIMSRSFGKKLVSELAREEPLRHTRFILPNELLGQS